MAKLIGNAIIRGKIHTLTGLHIGGSSDSIQIGGVDSPVLRDPHLRIPYIPGSSIKGKLRMLSEFANGVAREGGPSKDVTQKPAQIFGTSADDARIGPTRLIVRDAYPDEDTIEMWKKMDSDLLYTEEKGENTIDRITSKANPRFIERVVRGSKFDFEMVYSLYDVHADNPDAQIDDMANLEEVFKAMKLLEQSSIGGHGSRGYGRVEFLVDEISFFTSDDYRNATAVLENKGKLSRLSELNIEEELEKIRNLIS